MSRAESRSEPRNRRPANLHLVATCVALCVSGAAAPEDFGVELGLTAVGQVADDSRTDAELTASADLFLTLTQRRGEWLLYVEGSTTPDGNGVSSLYPTANADARSVLTRSGGGTVQVSEFNYTAFLPSDSTLMVGLIDPSAWLDRGRIANDENRQFLNGSFVNNATIAFPDYTLGAVYRRKARDGGPEITAILSSSSGLADLPQRSYQSLVNLFAGDRGAFAGAGASWTDQRTTWRAGVWLRSDQQPVISDSTSTEMNYGVYGVYGWQGDCDAWNIRLGFANEDLSVATRFAAIAYQRRTPYGTLGVGVAHTEIAQDLRERQLDPALDSELFFRMPLGPSAHITPSIQYVRNPLIRSERGGSSSATFIAGVRFHWSL